MAMDYTGGGVPELQLPSTSEELMEIKPYDIVADRQREAEKLAHSAEIEELTGTINVYDLNSIVTFGAETAEQISRASDVVLRSMSMTQLDDSSKMLNALAKVMDQFNSDELRDSTRVFDRLFGNMRRQLDRVLDKYQTMGDQIDKIYVQLKQYEVDIKRSNQQLEDMFQANVGYYHELVKYIEAGEQGCREIEEYMAQRRADMERTGDQTIQFELQTLQQALVMLQQRTHDLRTAETVAMQSVPMIRMMQMNNMGLVRKINSAFIITLPVFKQALAQAILLKRQKIQTDAISALDERTNKLLRQNAQNLSQQARLTAEMTTGSSIKVETLEHTWQSIMKGIDETRALQASAEAQRQSERQRLESIKQQYISRQV